MASLCFPADLAAPGGLELEQLLPCHPAVVKHEQLLSVERLIRRRGGRCQFVVDNRRSADRSPGAD